MTIQERVLPRKNHDPEKERKNTFGIGLLKGLGVTFKHLFKHNTVIQYPDEKQDLPSRTRGVIALKEENCTVCMLCARECPDWCIYIDSHKETLPPKREGGRPRKRNVLDRFAIDYALCMYCGICVEVCPYDALFWSREFEYAEYDIRELTHEKERLSDWMATVLPPPELEDGAEIPGQPAAPPATTTAAATGARPATTSSSAAEARPEQAAAAPKAGTLAPEPATAEREEALEQTGKAARTEVPEAAAPPAQTAAPEQAPAPSPPAAPTEPAEDPQLVYERTLKDQQDKGSSPQVAEARAKVARVKAERGLRHAEPTPVASVQPSAPEAGTPQEPVPPGAPTAEPLRPEPGPVAPTEEEKPKAEAPVPEAAAPEPEAPEAEEAPAPEAAAPEPEAPEAEDPDAIYERVLAEQRESDVSEAVAVARAKAARIRAQKGTKGPGG
jgi:formate hydrogenlyase subunit 6/NADH:ubiquinone oxidoreductase subunit I